MWSAVAVRAHESRFRGRGPEIGARPGRSSPAGCTPRSAIARRHPRRVLCHAQVEIHLDLRRQWRAVAPDLNSLLTGRLLAAPPPGRAERPPRTGSQPASSRISAPDRGTPARRPCRSPPRPAPCRTASATPGTCRSTRNPWPIFVVRRGPPGRRRPRSAVLARERSRPSCGRMELPPDRTLHCPAAAAPPSRPPSLLPLAQGRAIEREAGSLHAGPGQEPTRLCREPNYSGGRVKSGF